MLERASRFEPESTSVTRKPADRLGGSMAADPIPLIRTPSKLPKGTPEAFAAIQEPVTPFPDPADPGATEPVGLEGETALVSKTAPSGATALGGEENDLPVVPGDVIGERYAVERLLGAGGMGVVYLARHVELGHPVAIKFLRNQLVSKDNLVARFLEEARAAAALRSEHVVRVMDVGQLPSGIPYFVMEHLDGTDLHALLLRDGPFEADAAVDYMLQACEALREVHASGIVHRDVKPENLVLAAVGSRSIIKIVDFGIAKQLDPSRRVITDAGEQMGSPSYMSPEQMCTTNAVDQRSDIWSVGVVLYQLLTGHLPFDGVTVMEIFARVLNAPAPSPSSQREGIDPGLEAIVLRCLEKEPSARYADVDALVAALNGWRDGRAAAIEEARRTGEPSALSVPAPPAPFHPRPHRFGLAALVGAATIAAGFMGAYGADRSGLTDRVRDWGSTEGRGLVGAVVARIREHTDGRWTAGALAADLPAAIEPPFASDRYVVEPSGFVGVDPLAPFVTAEHETEVIDANTPDETADVKKARARVKRAREEARILREEEAARVREEEARAREEARLREARARKEQRDREDERDPTAQEHEPYDEYLARHGWRPLSEVLREVNAKHHPAAPPSAAPEAPAPPPEPPTPAPPEPAQSEAPSDSNSADDGTLEPP